MSTDLQLVAVQDALPVTFLDFEQGLEVPTLRAYGQDFRSASEIWINDSLVQTFIVVSDTFALVEIPSDQVGRPITKILILSTRFTATDRSVLRFRLSRMSRGIDGIEKLVQKWVRTFFTTPGRNIFNKADGGGAMQLLGASGGKYSSVNLTGGFAQAVDRTTSQLVASQPSTLPPNEKLATADLVGVNYDPQTGTLAGRVRLSSMAGRTALVNVYPGNE